MRCLVGDTEALERVWNESERFADMSAQVLNVGKSKGFGTTTAARKEVRAILPAEVEVAHIATNLGVDLVPGC